MIVSPNESRVILQNKDQEKEESNTLFRLADYEISSNGTITGRAELTRFTYKTIRYGYFDLEIMKIPV